MAATAIREPVIDVTVGDDVPDAHVDAIRKSVATMAKRQTETTLAGVDRDVELQRIALRLEQPLKRIVMADDDAAAAFESARAAEVDDPSTITRESVSDVALLAECGVDQDEPEVWVIGVQRDAARSPVRVVVWMREDASKGSVAGHDSNLSAATAPPTGPPCSESSGGGKTVSSR